MSSENDEYQLAEAVPSPEMHLSLRQVGGSYSVFT